MLSGGLGWKVEIQKVYMQQQKKISKVKKSMSLLAANLVYQSEDCQEIIVSQGNPEEALSQEIKSKFEAVQIKISTLSEKHKILTEQMLEVETNLDRW